MLRTTLRRLGLRAGPTRSRTLPTRLTLERLESRDVPSNSPIMVRAPYTPYSTPKIVASLPQQNPDHSQSLTYAIANDSRGDSITASVNQPQPHDQVLPGDGLWYTFMDRFGVASAPVFLEGLDYNKYDDGYTSDLTGEVAVAIAPGDPYSTAPPYRPFAIAYVRDEAYYSDPNNATPDWARETLYVRQFDANGVPLPGGPVAVAWVDLNNPPPQTHYSIHDVKIGADHCGGYTVAWLNDTQVSASYMAHGSQSIDLDVARVGSTAPPTVVAHSFLDTGTSGTPPSGWVGDKVAFPDLATNACGQSVVVWARLVRPTTYYYSGYLQTDHIYAQRVDSTPALVGPRLTVSQSADTYEASPVPRVATNDQGAFVVSWCYAPPYNPYVPVSVPRGIYARLYNAAGPVGNEFKVVDSPNTSGEGPNPYPYAVLYYVGHWNHPVGMDAAGNFVVGWYDSASDGSRTRLRVQAYTASGALRGDAFSLVETTNPWPNSIGLETYQLAMDADGDLVAAWGNPDNVPGLWRSVLAQRFLRADFVVQNGETQRSTIQFLSITFNPDTVDLAALVAGGRLRLTRYDLTGTGPGTPVSLDGVVSVSGNTVNFDFGPGGLANDGYYVLEADLDGDGLFESSWRFYRMYGDMTGTGLNNYPGLMPGLILNG